MAKFSIRVTWIVLALLFSTSPARPSTGHETGFLNRTVTVSGVEYRYQVYVPREFDRRRRWPVILFLHGGGEYGSDGLKQTNVGIATAIRKFPERFPAIVVFPQAKADGTPGWQQEGGKAALAALDRSIKEFKGDPERTYLTGLSAGGNGSWYLASQYPERWAAALIVCGFISKFTGRSTVIDYPALAGNEEDPYMYIARRTSSIPIWIYHGDKDDVVSPEESRKMFAALKTVGADVRYTEVPGANHNSWDTAYSNTEVVEWMLKQRRAKQ